MVVILSTIVNKTVN